MDKVLTSVHKPIDKDKPTLLIVNPDDADSVEIKDDLDIVNVKSGSSLEILEMLRWLKEL